MGSTEELIRNVSTAILLLFNVGMGLRISVLLISIQTGDDGDETNARKRIRNCVKATVVTNCIIGIINLLKAYFS